MKATAHTTAYDTLGKVELLSGKVTGNTYLMQNPEGELYVKKLISSEKLPIYEQLKLLKHQGLADILAIQEEGSNYAVIKAYIKGETLSTMLRDKKRLRESEAINYICQLCLILDKIHQRGIIHRDINPNNIIITPEKRVKLIDFGIARTYKEEQMQDTQLLGTPGYAAPEQFGFDQTNAGSDIFALGVLFNVMLTGENPKVTQAPNERLAAIIKACTAMDPSVRYQDVLQIDYDLRQLSASTAPVIDHQQERSHISEVRARKASKAIVIGTLLLGLLALGVFLFRLMPETNSTPVESSSGVGGTPITAADFIGRWHNGSGDIIERPFGNALTSERVEFLDDATIILTDRYGEETTSIWQITESGILLAEGNEFTVEVEGNVLTITDSRGRIRLWQRDDEESAQSIDEVEGGAIEESNSISGDADFIGRWHNGSGSLIERPFGNALTSEGVEFLDDATIILIDRYGEETTSIWQVTESGILLAEGNEFTVEISGNILTITDSRGRARMWQHASK